MENTNLKLHSKLTERNRDDTKFFRMGQRGITLPLMLFFDREV